MSETPKLSSDVAFTPSVKAVQTRKGSRGMFERVEQAGGWETSVTPELAAFISRQTSFFLATASAAGQPYIQHRGGPAGFVHVLDEKTLAFADFLGNRQFITTGNLAENPKAQIFFIDYSTQERIKVWGAAHVAENETLTESLMPKGYKARALQAIMFRVETWDVNCSQHIPRRVEASEVEAMGIRIRELEAELAKLEGKS
jgi:predicted pyridoxine 5'-phosphate oxidase superfamily flavin-nucleotide-binding protein